MSTAEPARRRDPAPAEQRSAAATPGEPGSWPHGVSRAATMSIGAALAALTSEFPAVTISKVRFLEEQGIVRPQRTAAGYRTYSQADIERLRFALAAQRDSFLPLKVIRERLAELDSDGAGAPNPGARLVTEDGDLTQAATNSRMTRAQLAQACDLTEAEIQQYLDSGMVAADFSGKFGPSAINIIRQVRLINDLGIDPRHLRPLRNAAEHQIELVRQVITPVRSRRRTSASAEAADRANEMGEALATLFSHLVNDRITTL